jgi:hypothetical protein
MKHASPEARNAMAAARSPGCPIAPVNQLVPVLFGEFRERLFIAVALNI